MFVLILAFHIDILICLLHDVLKQMVLIYVKLNVGNVALLLYRSDMMPCPVCDMGMSCHGWCDRSLTVPCRCLVLMWAGLSYSGWQGPGTEGGGRYSEQVWPVMIYRHVSIGPTCQRVVCMGKRVYVLPVFFLCWLSMVLCSWLSTCCDTNVMFNQSPSQYSNISAMYLLLYKLIREGI